MDNKQDVYDIIGKIRHDIVRIADSIYQERKRHNEELNKLLAKLQDEVLKVTDLACIIEGGKDA